MTAQTPPHLLTSRQYRAAELLTRSEQELRGLRPLRTEDYSAARAVALPQQGVSRVQEIPQRSIGNDRERTQAAVSWAPETAETAHEKALNEIRRIQLATPVAYQNKATEAMSRRLQNQLMERRPSVDLSASYRGDPGQAADAHRQAVETNMDLIEATRKAGVPVNIGQATVVSSEKKHGPEVSSNRQVDRGETEQNLQQQAVV